MNLDEVRKVATKWTMEFTGGAKEAKIKEIIDWAVDETVKSVDAYRLWECPNCHEDLSKYLPKD